MPPYSQYSSQIDGSLYITSSNNAAKHGNGAALIENGVSLFGSADQYFQSTNLASDLIVDSKKVLKVGPTDSTGVEVSKLGVNTKVKGSFNVDQVSTLTGDVIASSNLNVAGISTFANSVNAQGAANFASTVTVDGASTLKGPVSCESTLASSGAATFASTVSVNGTSTLVGDVNMSNNCVIAGNLTVQGNTTSIDTQNVLVEDNVMVLNSASAVGKDAGFMFKRGAGADSTAFWWDELDKTFVLASTESLGTDETLDIKELQKLKCAGVEATSALVAPGFATTTVSLAGNSAVPVSIPGVVAQRGSFEFIIEADNVDGSVFNYKIVKNKAASTSPSLMGVHQSGDDETQVWIQWDLNKAPEIYHKFTNASADLITYKIKYLRVD